MKTLKWWQVIIFILIVSYFRGCFDEDLDMTGAINLNTEKSIAHNTEMKEPNPYEDYPFLASFDEIIKGFKSIKLDTNYSDWSAGIPKYTKYYADHIKFLRKIDSSFVRDSVGGYKNDSLYMAGKKSLIDSMMNTKEVKKAFKNVIYGDCGYYDIERTVKKILKRTANDPKSISVVSLSLGKNLKDGIQVIVSYRGKNKFGALVLDEITLVLKNKPRAIRDINRRWSSYEAYDDDYEVISAY
jgi:hypothetical protein